jgi:hypothetical protein
MGAMGTFWQLIGYLHLVVPLCLVICLIVGAPILFHRWARRKWPADEKREALKQTRLLATILLAAVWLDEGVVRIVPLSDSLRMLYTLTYAVKWEIAALLATLLISLSYWRAQKRNIGKIELNHHFKAMTWLWSGVICFIGACMCLAFLVTTFDEQTFRIISFLHFACLIALSGCFWGLDYHIYKGINPNRQSNDERKRMYELKRTSHNLVYLVDVPVFISLSLLGAFCVLHWLEHRFSGSVRPYLYAPPRAIDPVNIWASEDYFVSGVIAFQYVAMTVISVIVEFNPKPDMARRVRTVVAHGGQ